MNAHVAVKSIYVGLFRGTGSMHTRSFTARAAWAAICGALWVLSWIIAEGIPVFNDVLGLAVCHECLGHSTDADCVFPEFTLCQLVFVRASSDVLALFKPALLDRDRAPAVLFCPQYGASTTGGSDCE